MRYYLKAREEKNVWKEVKEQHPAHMDSVVLRVAYLVRVVIMPVVE